MGRTHRTHRTIRMPLRVAACALALVGLVAPSGQAAQGAQGGQSGVPLASGGTLATMEQCVSSADEAERSATFAGEMAAIPGSTRMSIRIDVEERLPEELDFHTVKAAGLGVWRPSDQKVKIYKYLKQVTNLSAPASYRGLVRFRWLNSSGHVMKRASRLTTRCLQTTAASEPGSGGTTPGTVGSGGAGSSSAPTA